jgi:hypothetical protein
MRKEIHLNVRKTANIKIDLKKNIVFANQYALEVLGMELNEILMQPPRIVCSDDMPAIIHNTIGSFIMSYKEGIAILKHRSSCDDYFWAFTQYKPVFKKDGTFEAFLTRRKPIPERKINGEIDLLKAKISKLYSELKEIEDNAGMEEAEKYLASFLKENHFESLDEYYMSFFDADYKEMEKYFNIDEKTPGKIIKKYFPSCVC